MAEHAKKSDKNKRGLMEVAKGILKLIFIIQKRVLRKNQRVLSNRDYSEKVFNQILIALVSRACPKICYISIYQICRLTVRNLRKEIKILFSFEVFFKKRRTLKQRKTAKRS